MKYAITGLMAVTIAAPVLGEIPSPTAVTQTVEASTNSTTGAVVPSAVLPAQPVAVLAPAVQESILRAGAEVPLRTREELTTQKKKLRVGQRFQMEVASNIEMNGTVVIPAGTPVVGEITEVRNKGMWGKSGYINARVISLRHGDRTVRLSGTFDDKGVTGTAGVVGAVALVPIAGFFMTGTSARIPNNSPVKAFLDEDVVFRTVAAAPQVVEIPAAIPGAIGTSAPAPADAPVTPATTPSEPVVAATSAAPARESK